MLTQNSKSVAPHSMIGRTLKQEKEKIMKKQTTNFKTINRQNLGDNSTVLNNRVANFVEPSKALRLLLIPVAFIMLTIALVGSAQAQVRTQIPEEDPGPPFYARVERSSVHTQIVPHTDEWAAIVFYRSPACVPPNFNLMDLFNVPGAFFCQLTIEGFEIWRNGPPPVDFAPMQAKFNGLGAVPVWFVSWSELQAAIADDVLTITELQTLSSLQKGTATFFRETLHPTGGANQPKLSITARGTLEDGRIFQLHHSGSVATVQTTISFR